MCLVACSHVYSTASDDARPPSPSDAHPFPLPDAAIEPQPSFVVNNLFAGDQFLTNDYEAAGLQLAATDNGIWTAVFREQCTNCYVWGRRFDGTGNAVSSQIAGSTSQFVLDSAAVTNATTPAIAGSGLTTLVLWDYTTTAGSGIACRVLDAQGRAPFNERTIVSEPADVVTASSLDNGNFVVTWQAIETLLAVRATIVKPDCTALLAPFTVSATGGATGATRAHAASNAISILYAWIVDSDLHLRAGSLDGALVGNEITLLTHTLVQEPDYVRVVPWGADFAVAVRWAGTSGTAAGRIEVYRVSAAGQIVGGPTVVADPVASDFASNHAFGIARRSDDVLFLAWHDCPSGAGSCVVRGRYVFGDGAVGTFIPIAGPGGGDHTDPSVVAVNNGFVVAWNDSSAQAPDTSGMAVRAQIMYPLF